MTRILAFGDLQLGVGTEYGRERTGPDSRLADQARILDEIVDLAVAHNVDAILDAGDTFEGREILPEQLDVFARFVDLCHFAGISILAITGNGRHDAAVRTTNGMQIFSYMPGITVSSRPELHALPGTDVTVVTLPWVHPGRLIAARNGGDRDQIDTDVARLLVDAAAELRAQCPPRCTTILLAHWSVSEASTPSGLPVDAIREPVLDAYALDELGFDYVILGHIHKPQVLVAKEADGKLAQAMLYVGSPNVVDFGEAHVEHGCWIIDTEGETVFRTLNDRRFVTLDGRVTASGEFTYGGHVGPALRDAVVRVRYEATAEEARHLDHNAIRRELYDAGAWKVWGIFPTIVREGRARVDGLDDQVSELDALDLWITENPSPAVAPSVLLERTARYLEELAA